MNILVACHSETEDSPLFIYQPPLFNTPVPLVADYVDPYRSGKKWKDYDAASKDIIWDQYCPILWPFRKVRNYLYHDSIFYNLFNDGWKILKPGGILVIPFPKNLRSIHGWEPIDTETALDNFKSVLKQLLSKHPWAYHIVKRESMPFIIAERYAQEEQDDYIVFVKPVVIGGRSKSRRRHRRSYRV